MHLAVQAERCCQANAFHRRKKRKGGAHRPCTTSTDGPLRRDARMASRRVAGLFWRIELPDQLLHLAAIALTVVCDLTNTIFITHQPIKIHPALLPHTNNSSPDI